MSLEGAHSLLFSNQIRLEETRKCESLCFNWRSLNVKIIDFNPIVLLWDQNIHFLNHVILICHQFSIKLAQIIMQWVTELELCVLLINSYWIFTGFGNYNDEDNDVAGMNHESVPYISWNTSSYSDLRNLLSGYDYIKGGLIYALLNWFSTEEFQGLISWCRKLVNLTARWWLDFQQRVVKQLLL